MHGERREFFDVVDSRPPEKQKDLIEIHWPGKDEIEVKVFLFTFAFYGAVA